MLAWADSNKKKSRLGARAKKDRGRWYQPRRTPLFSSSMMHVDQDTRSYGQGHKKMLLRNALCLCCGWAHLIQLYIFDSGLTHIDNTSSSWKKEGESLALLFFLPINTRGRGRDAILYLLLWWWISPTNKTKKKTTTKLINKNKISQQPTPQNTIILVLLLYILFFILLIYYFINILLAIIIIYYNVMEGSADIDSLHPHTGWHSPRV